MKNNKFYSYVLSCSLLFSCNSQLPTDKAEKHVHHDKIPIESGKYYGVLYDSKLDTTYYDSVWILRPVSDSLFLVHSFLENNKLENTIKRYSATERFYLSDTGILPLVSKRKDRAFRIMIEFASSEKFTYTFRWMDYENKNKSFYFILLANKI